jgi:hypothetical protein
MNRARRLLRLLAFAAAAVTPGAAQDFLDHFGDALTTSGCQDRFRAKLSGALDFEFYDFQPPAPALLHTEDGQLFNPRLSLFLDVQLGGRAYFFAQARVDRGFDPDDDDLTLRLDEYALRLTPWDDGRFSVQLGKFATVVGNWTPRHDSWANPFIDAPLPYENLTGVWDVEPARSSTQLLQWSHVRPGLPAFVTAGEKYRRLPIVWGPSYATGMAVSGALGKFLYAVELKHASLSSRPETWSRTEGHWQHPTLSGRVAWRPNQMWTLGFSASEGAYLQPSAGPSLPAGRGLGDYRQLVLGQDVSFAWHHLQAWAEIYESRFEIPGISDGDTVAYYAEAKYKFTPQFFGGLRWNQQFFNRIVDRGAEVRWGKDVWRMDLVGGYRFTAHTQLKLQYNLQRGDVDPRDYAHLLAAQLTVRF